MSFEEFLQSRLDLVDRHKQRRRLHVSTAPTGPLVTLEGETRHNFASNDYLGLAAHPAVVGAAARALRDFGAGSGASRLVTGSQSPHAGLEDQLADFKSTPAALCFGSGYAAATGVLATLAGRGDVVLLDRLAHACLVDGARLSGATLRVFRHNDADDLDHQLRRLRLRHPQARLFVVTESVFSMDGDVAPLRELVAAKERHGAVMVLDEAHATGVLGPSGRGLASAQGLSERIEVQMGTLGKALGSVGGFIAGSRLLIDLLVNKARSFIYSTAPPAAAAAAAAAALEVCRSAEGEERRSLLRRHAACFRPLAPAAIHPVILGEEEAALQAARELAAGGFHVPAIRPPTVPRGTSRLRISFSAAHDPAVVAALSEALSRLANVPMTPSVFPHPDELCPVCGAPLVHEKCKVLCRSAVCGHRIIFNCSEF